jgi:plastocyanin
MRRGGIVAALAAGSLLLAGGALAAEDGAEEEPAAHVNANGNAFTGGLEFDPVEVSVAVRDVVAWTNTDPGVPHTATEDHGLWELSGDYGDPGPYQGFGPGETVSRAFDAGTFSYYCVVHPEEMRGVVEVPVTLRARNKVFVRWGSGPLPEGQVFDVQRRARHSEGSERSQRRGGNWRTVLESTTLRRARFGYGPASVTVLAFRARVRDASDPDAVSGWSPPASVALD